MQTEEMLYQAMKLDLLLSQMEEEIENRKAKEEAKENAK